VPRLAADGSFAGYIGSCIDITDRKRAEHTAQFLAEAGDALSSLVDLESTLEKIANLAVPFFADWCLVDLVDAQLELGDLAAILGDRRDQRAALAVEPRRVALERRDARDLHQVLLP